MTHYLTPQGLAELQKELATLQTQKLPEILESLNKARSEGDLSENAAYTSSRDQLEQAQIRESELLSILSDVSLIKDGDVDNAPKTISIGSTVEVEYENIPGKKNFVLTIVGNSEANPLENRIGNKSPLALALLKKKIGETVSFVVKGKEMKVTILKIIS
jgi:transcription elongation factor GreA